AGQILNLQGEERPAARFVSKFFKRLIAALLLFRPEERRGVYAYSVDRDLVLLRGFKRFRQRNAAGVVITVRDENHNKPPVLAGKLFRHGQIDGVIERSAAAGADGADLIGQFFRIIGEILKKIDA